MPTGERSSNSKLTVFLSHSAHSSLLVIGITFSPRHRTNLSVDLLLALHFLVKFVTSLHYSFEFLEFKYLFILIFSNGFEFFSLQFIVQVSFTSVCSPCLLDSFGVLSHCLSLASLVLPCSWFVGPLCLVPCC